MERPKSMSALAEMKDIGDERHAVHCRGLADLCGLLALLMSIVVIVRAVCQRTCEVLRQYVRSAVVRWPNVRLHVCKLAGVSSGRAHACYKF